MKKVLALLLCLVLVLIPLSSAVTFADPPSEGYELDEDNKTYTVYTPEGYNAVAALLNNGYLDYNITLANDLTFTKDGDAANFTTIGKAAVYTGTFDGAGYTISGLQTASDTLNASGKADANNRYRALIGQAGNGCTVKDLTITDSEFYGSEYISAVIGSAGGGNITVSNVHVRNTVIAGDTTSGKTVGNNVAGFCGRFVNGAAGNATFENCTIDATIRSFKNAVGICGGEATSGALNVTICNCAIAGEIETTVTSAKQGCTAGFFGWTNGVNLTIENSVCLATLKSAVNECGFVNNLLRASTITMTNVVGIGRLFGNYNTADMNVTFTNCAVIDPDADIKTGSGALWSTLPASVPGTLTIDGEVEDFLTATMPLVSIGSMKNSVQQVCGSNPELLAKAIELVDATALKLSGVTFQALQESKIDEVANTRSIRLIGTIDAHYTQVSALGFDVAYTASDSTVYAAKEIELKKVYTSVLANEDGNMVAHNAAEFDADYIFALTLEDVPVTGTCTFTVTPFVKSAGFKWAGTAYQITYVDGVLASYTSV